MKITPNLQWTNTLSSVYTQRSNDKHPASDTLFTPEDDTEASAAIVTLSQKATATESDETEKQTASSPPVSSFNPIKEAENARKNAARMRVAQIKQQLKTYLDMNVGANPYIAKSLVSTLRRLADELKAAAAILLEGNQNSAARLATLSFSPNASATPSAEQANSAGSTVSDTQDVADAGTTAAEAYAVAAELSSVDMDLDLPPDSIGEDAEIDVPDQNASTSPESVTAQGNPPITHETPESAPASPPSAAADQTKISEMRADAKLVSDTLSKLKTLASLVRMHLRSKEDKDEDKALLKTVDDLDKMLTAHNEAIEAIESGADNLSVDLSISDLSVTP